MTMMTRQRNDYVREIDYLKNEVDALKYKKYMHSSYGVLSFILIQIGIKFLKIVLGKLNIKKIPIYKKKKKKS